MNFRDFFRGFFGIKPPTENPSLPNSNSSGNNDIDSEEWRRVRPPPLDDYGDLISRRPERVFGDVLSAVEEMMRDMEQSMQDFDKYFEEFGIGPEGFSDNEKFAQQPRLFARIAEEQDAIGGCLPPLPQPSAKDGNVRDLVLKKEKEYPKLSTKDKVDKDLDEAYAKSGLDISLLPAPSKDEPSFVQELLPRSPPAAPTYPSNGGFSSTFERVYSTYSFNNGKWEGKTVRENPQGKEITTYTRDEHGQLNETTEYIPKTQNSLPNYSQDTNIISPQKDESGLESPGYYSPFNIFNKFFKPKL